MYWIARESGGVSIVAGKRLFLLHSAGRDLAGSFTRYDSASGAALATADISARRMVCPEETQAPSR
jgi:hypothetical protein